MSLVGAGDGAPVVRRPVPSFGQQPSAVRIQPIRVVSSAACAAVRAPPAWASTSFCSACSWLQVAPTFPRSRLAPAARTFAARLLPGPMPVDERGELGDLPRRPADGEVRLRDVEEDVADRLDLDPRLVAVPMSGSATPREPSFGVLAASTSGTSSRRRPTG